MLIVSLIFGSIFLLCGTSLVISGFVGIYKRFSFSNYRDKDRVIINILYGIIFIFIGMFPMENIFILNLIFTLLAVISLIIVRVFDFKTKSQNKKIYGGGPSDG